MSLLIGHADTMAAVRRGLAGDRLSHAYLITGPRGVGRRTLALEIAKMLNCEAPTQHRPCGQCRSCRLIGRGVHPDVRVIKRAPDRREIIKDDVAFIQSDAQLRPADGRKKAYLVLNVEELGTLPANRLLKTIEEPTHFVHFLLTAADRAVVLPTIASRCQELRLRPVPQAELAAALVARNLVEADVAARVAALSGGRPGVALASAQDPSFLSRHETDVSDLYTLLAANRLQRLVYARTLADRWSPNRDAVQRTLRTWLTWWRDVLLVQLGLPERTLHRTNAELRALTGAAQQIPVHQARTAQAHVQQTLTDLDANVNARLALDLLLLRLPQANVLPADF